MLNSLNPSNRSSKLGTFVLFADDTNIFVCGKNRIDAIRAANVVLDAVYSYMKANKLHINFKKCVYMHFKPNSRQTNCDEENGETVKINGIHIEEVTETKFLGVVIDNELSWLPHIKYLCKKLKCNTGVLNRIKDFIPGRLHKTLYHTLFESHLSYGITVWGRIPESKMKSVFTTQKHCIRMMFGDNDAYLEKFRTCVRTRPVEDQQLGSEFYTKEHTKPLLNAHDIFTVQNLYNYHTVLDTFKILKTHTPISLFSCLTISQRKQTLLIPSQNPHSYAYKASTTWNSFRAVLPAGEINDFSVGFASMKNKIRQLLLNHQKIGDRVEWCDENFQIKRSSHS